MIRSIAKLVRISRPAVSAALSERGGASAALVCAICATATAARAETLKAQYSMSLLGISIGHASVSGFVEGQKYRIEMSMRTSGLASLVNDTKGAASASGAFTRNGPTPATYANTTSNQWETRTVRMALSGNSVRSVDVQPIPWDLAIRVPVTESNKTHVLDPVSALIMAVPPGESLTGPAACNRNIPVYDGVARFDVALSYVETREVETRGYSGPVSVCAARYRPIAGHRPDSASTKFMAENGDINVWLAPLPGARVVVPYRIALRTSAGALTIEAAEFRVGQRHAAGR
jgi:hypothetical protein